MSDHPLLIYTCVVAPNPTRVRIYTREKRLLTAGLVEEVSINMRNGEQNSPEHRVRAPFGTVPVLRLPNGVHIDESIAIVEYLEERFPTPPLIGQVPAERAYTRRLDRIAELRVLRPAAAALHFSHSPFQRPRNPAGAAIEGARLAKGLAFFEDLLRDERPYLTGQRFTIADCTLFAGLFFPNRYGIEHLHDNPLLLRWWKRCHQRPAVQAALP